MESARGDHDGGPAACDLLLTAACIVTQDDERRVLEDAALAVSDGRVAAVGPRAAMERLPARERLDLGNSLVLPGLINAHTHVAMTLFRGLADDLPLMEWLGGHIFPREKHLDAAMVELGALLGCAEMLRTGTTAFMDMYLIEDAVARAVARCGLKARLGEGVFAFPSPAYPAVDQGLSLVREQARRHAGEGRIRAAVMPHTVYTTTVPILEACRDLAVELDLPLHIHMSETADEVQECLRLHGKRPPELLLDLGLLGPRATLAHCVALTDAETDLVAASGARVVHCPKSNMKLGSGVAPVPGMLKRGMLPGLGTDGAASNNSLNMFAEMNACALVHKGVTNDPTLCPARTVLDMATLGGAAALHWPGIGSLAPGSAADLVALDLDAPNLRPLYNPVSHLVYAASGQEVRLTMVDGKVLYKDGRYLSLDYPALLAEAQGAARWVRQRCS